MPKKLMKGGNYHLTIDQKRKILKNGKNRHQTIKSYLRVFWRPILAHFGSEIYRKAVFKIYSTNGIKYILYQRKLVNKSMLEAVLNNNLNVILSRKCMKNSKSVI